VKKQWGTRPEITSIRHPTCPNLLQPLWAGNFWYSAVGAVEQRKEWERAMTWVSNLVQDRNVYEARGLMMRIPWGTNIWALVSAESSSLVGVLAGILSAGWLRECQLDTLTSYLNFRASRDGKGVEHAKCGSQQWQATQVYFYILYRYSTTLPLVVG
jgi:hypothetical protein